MAWACSFWSWPVLPVVDRDVLEAVGSTSFSTLAGRRAQDALIVGRFPSLAALPLDRGSYSTIPLLPGLKHKLAARLKRLLRRPLYPTHPILERRYYHRVWDLNNPGWRNIRREAEPSRERAYDYFNRGELDSLLPAPDQEIQSDNIIYTSGLKIILGFLLSLEQHPSDMAGIELERSTAMLNREFPVGPRDWGQLPTERTQDRLDVGPFQVMQRWEFPLMKALAVEVAREKGDILEIGFGMGISAGEIVKAGVRSYTVIEAHPEIAAFASDWAKAQPVPCTVIKGYYQDVAPDLERRFDGILFDAYPNSKEEWTRFHLDFFPVARKLLRTGGVFAYFSGQTVKYSHEHLEALFRHFDDIRLLKVGGIKPPKDCDYWKHDYMVLPIARRSAD